MPRRRHAASRRSSSGPDRQEPGRLGRLETLGAWLRVWTPPKGATVPPFPARRAALIGLVICGLIAAGAVIAVPRIEDSKRRGADEERRALAERRASERRRLEAEGAPVTGRVRPRGRSTAASQRRALIEAVERAVTSEARARVARGALRGRIVRTECVAAAGGGLDERRGRGVYDCLAVTRDIPATRTNAPGLLGHPFRAVLDFRRFTFAFCKTNPAAGERAVPDPRSLPRLARACSG